LIVARDLEGVKGVAGGFLNYRFAFFQRSGIPAELSDSPDPLNL
jgi:hypothetical protein